MQHLLATLFSLLIALCHHTTLSARPVEAAEVPSVIQTTIETPGPALVLPDRYQLARYGTSDASYAGMACTSCRRGNGSTSDR